MTHFSLDKKHIRQSFAKASLSYDRMAGLQRKVGRELISSVALVENGTVLDIGCGTGFFTQQLRDRVLLADIVALDIAVPMLLKTKERLPDAGLSLVCADAEGLPFVSSCMAAVVSNLALQWCLNIDAMFQNVERILQRNGQFVFSTFGEHALCELKAAWAMVDDDPHVNDFCSVSDIEQKLQAQGFVDIQLETYVYQEKYASVIELMRELKGIGAHNVHHARHKQLTGKGKLQALLEAYPQDKEGGISASFEIIYVCAKAGEKL